MFQKIKAVKEEKRCKLRRSWEKLNLLLNNKADLSLSFYESCHVELSGSEQTDTVTAFISNMYFVFLYRTSEEDELLTGYITEHITFVDFPDLYTALIAETFCKVAR